jgi:uncharacterized protein (TIGR02271 family)
MNTNTDFSNYIGHDVVDSNGNKVGTLECLWTDHTGQPTFLGVKTGWFLGKTHVVPAHTAKVSQQGRTIRLPYDGDRVKNAPCYDGDVQLDERAQGDVYRYYGIQMPEQPRSEQTRQATRATSGREQASMALHEEELKVGKREVEYGGMRLKKIIRTETVNQPVELKREEMVVERVPGKQAAQTGGKAFEQEEIYIPLRREEPVVQKEARVREQVNVGKRSQTERQNVSEQVRKEDVKIDRSSEAARSSGGATQTRSGTTQTRGSEFRSRDRRGDKAVFAIATSEEQAARVVDQLKSAGFSRDDVSVMFGDKRTSKAFAHEKETKAPEGATAGAATGGVLGGVLGWLAGAGALAIPGVGPLIAAGPIMAALSGAAIGGATGGIAGGLIGLGIPEYEAKRYENRIRDGNILISVHSDSSDETKRAKEIFERNGAEDIGTANEKELQSRNR